MSDHYVIDLPPTHTFPIQKYRLIREQLLAEGTLTSDELIAPTLAHPVDILLVHSADYWEGLVAGTLPENVVRRMGLPWSDALVRRSRASVQGTLTAARIAIREGVAVNLAGGTHHAFPDRGEGYCGLNDIAIAVRRLQRDAWMQRMAVIDCDVHQGNGTATVFAGEPDVFTCSVHGANNYPLTKVPGDLNIGLPDGTGDVAYLEILETVIPQVVEEFRPGLVFYLAGVDPHEGDRLGRLRLTHQGLRRRDELVLQACRAAGVPVAITLGGGVRPESAGHGAGPLQHRPGRTRRLRRNPLTSRLHASRSAVPGSRLTLYGSRFTVPPFTALGSLPEDHPCRPQGHQGIEPGRQGVDPDGAPPGLAQATE